MEALLEDREAKLQETWRAIQAQSELRARSNEAFARDQMDGSRFGSKGISKITSADDRGRNATGALSRTVIVHSGLSSAADGWRQARKRWSVIEGGEAGEGSDTDHVMEQIMALLKEAGGDGEEPDHHRLLNQQGGWSRGEPSSITSAKLLLTIGGGSAMGPSAAAQQRAAVAEMERRRTSLAKREGVLQVSLPSNLYPYF